MRLPSVIVLTSVVLTLSCASGTEAPEPQDSVDEMAVLAAVQGFFDTMTSRDAEGARAVLDPDGDFVSVRWNDAGERMVRRSSNEDYLRSLATDTEEYVERMWEPEVWVHGPIAMVWTAYDFHIDGRFSHCGIDAFQLLRTTEGWMITGGTYTVERVDCADSPLGPLAD